MPPSYSRFQIGTAVFDIEGQYLANSAGVVKTLPGIAFDILSAIAQSPGGRISQNDLIDEVYRNPEEDKEYANALQARVTELRKIIKEHGAEIGNDHGFYVLSPVVPCFSEQVHALLKSHSLGVADYDSLLSAVRDKSCVDCEVDIPKADYSRLQELFECAPGEAHVFGLPASPCRLRNMTREVAAIIYEKRYENRRPTPAQLQEQTDSANERARKFRRRIESGSPVNLFLPLREFQDLIKRGLFQITRQPLSELNERLDAIAYWLDSFGKTFHVYLVSRELARDNTFFYLKEHKSSKGTVHFLLRFIGQDRDKIEIKVCRGEGYSASMHHEEMKFINGWISMAKSVQQYPANGDPGEEVFAFDSGTDFKNWVSKYSKAK